MRPAVTVLDLGLPPRPDAPDEGLSTLAGLLDLDGVAKVIIISGQDRENAVRAVGAGAFDFFARPWIWKGCDLTDIRAPVQLRRSIWLRLLAC